MTRILNALDAATAQRIRDAIAGKPQLREAKPKKVGKVKCYVSQFHSYDPRKDAHTLQLPIAFDRNMYNAGRVPFYLREKYVREMREMVWLAMSAYLPKMSAPSVRFSRVRPDELQYTAPSYVKFIPDDERAVRAFCASARAMRERARVRRIEFVRIASNKLDDDNIIGAFKAIRDALCSRLFWGESAQNHVRAIGTADDKLWKAGVRWTYRQRKCESNPRLYGIRLVLHCAPRTTE